MTLLIGMKFSESCGAIISDEQANSGGEKFYSANKIWSQQFKDSSFLFAATGTIEHMYESISDLSKYKVKNKNKTLKIEDVIKNFENLISENNINSINKFLKTNYGITLTDFLSSSCNDKKLSEDSLNTIKICLSEFSKNNLNNGYVVLAQDKNSTKLYKSNDEG